MTPKKEVEPSVTLHKFSQDLDSGRTWDGLYVCSSCHKPGAPGDAQHPNGAPPLLPVFGELQVLEPTPADDVSDRMIGEGGDAA